MRIHGGNISSEYLQANNKTGNLVKQCLQGFLQIIWMLNEDEP